MYRLDLEGRQLTAVAREPRHETIRKDHHIADGEVGVQRKNGFGGWKAGSTQRRDPVLATASTLITSIFLGN